MSKFTIATAKKALALAYPDIQFTYGTAGRGRQSGPSVSWVGGPTPELVRAAACAPSFHYSGMVKYHFVRQPTPEEYEEMQRKWDEEHRARVAAEPARRAAAKAAGIEKRKATHEAKCVRLAVLFGAFPGVEFDLSGGGIAWTDGPERAEVINLVTGAYPHNFTRCRTPEGLAREAAEKAAKVHAGRLARRLAHSKARAFRIPYALERRRLATIQHAPRLERNPEQFVLPLDFPIWEKPSMYMVRIAGVVQGVYAAGRRA